MNVSSFLSGVESSRVERNQAEQTWVALTPFPPSSSSSQLHELKVEEKEEEEEEEETIIPHTHAHAAYANQATETDDLEGKREEEIVSSSLSQVWN